VRFIITLAFAVVLAGAQGARADDADDTVLSVIDDAAFDDQFQCPETLTDADVRLDQYQRYDGWARLRHPDWSLRKRLDVRYGLLRRHSCAVTLANIAASARPPFQP
jgi:hypothetical protein